MGMNNFTGNTSGNTGANGLPAGIQNPLAPQGAPDATEYLINYNDKFGQTGKAMFRDSVVSQTMAVMLGKNKPNALLVGQAGVGKTKIVEDIAYRLVAKDPSVPDKLLGSVIYELPLSNIVAGSGIVGELEEKAKAVIDFISDPANHAILFIDEIHQLVGGSQIYDKIAQILKPALARGDMKVIGATTLQEATNLTADPALNRRFSRVIVDELTNEQTVEILEKSTGSYIQHYNNKVAIDNAILPMVVEIANQYGAAGNHRPDTAITLLDRACGDAIVARKAQEVAAANDPAILQAIKATPFVAITAKQLKRTAITLMTGHAKKDVMDKDEMMKKLDVIKGQDDIIKDVVDRLAKDDKALYPRTKPLTFLFAGSSGVGKTEVTKIIAKELTGVKPITLNMPEFHSSASINRIIGAPAGYVGSDSHAELPFDVLESNPYQVILLDEFEKADRSVQTLFMGAFDEGCIKTSKGRLVDFSKAIIIATTNASHTTGKSTHIGFNAVDDSANARRQAIADLAGWFPPELLNRFNMVLTFHNISKDDYKDILADTYKRDIARIKTNHRITLPDELDDATLDNMVKETYVPEFGARPAKRAIRDYIEENA